jgi:broad specificity phosphatase PhoE
VSLLLLVRHGQAAVGAYTGGSGELTELGRRQAAATGQTLLSRGVTPDRLVSGSPTRQQETLALLGEAFSPDEPSLETDERWDEYDGTALLAAYPPAGEPPGPGESKARFFQQVLDDSLGRWMAGEPPVGAGGALGSWDEFMARPTAAVSDLAASLGRGGTAVVATSAGVISSVVADLLGLTPAALLGIHRIVVNASVTSVILGSRGRHLLTFNEHGHLQADDTGLVTYR